MCPPSAVILCLPMYHPVGLHGETRFGFEKICEFTAQLNGYTEQDKVRKGFTKGLADDEASTSKKIIMIINQDNNVTTERIANLLNISRRAVAKHMKRLQENGIICRVGGRAIGHCVFVKK